MGKLAQRRGATRCAKKRTLPGHRANQSARSKDLPEPEKAALAPDAAAAQAAQQTNDVLLNSELLPQYSKGLQAYLASKKCLPHRRTADPVPAASGHCVAPHDHQGKTPGFDGPVALKL
jgi:hypothetical protein